MVVHKKPLSAFPKDTVFSSPIKRIFDSQTTIYFQHSEALTRLKFFVSKYTSLVESKTYYPKNEAAALDKESSGALMDVIEILNRLSGYIDDIPPFEGPRRYGNLACRIWHDKLNAVITDEITNLLRRNGVENIDNGFVLEMTYYIQNCFGSKTRLDFGTGHELSFVAFIAALDMSDLLPNLTGYTIMEIFNHYYKLVKKLILTYTLEPAGSHGVWGLDDHFHFIYLLGASQWIGNEKIILPKDMLDKSVLNQYKDQNFYCMALSFIFQVKSGPFSEHSPILYDISHNVKHWSKVFKGLMKMYDEEVLNKYPVVQHFWFGTGFFPWIDTKTEKPLPAYEIVEDSQEELETSHNTNIDNDITTGMPNRTAYTKQPITYHTNLHTPTIMTRNETIPSTINNAFSRKPQTAPSRTITSMAPPSSRTFNNYTTSARNLGTTSNMASSRLAQDEKLRNVLPKR
ncbi:similar to Saccharomyces cerevisiae YIL153W RRD1 Peptidyl-prolyl cis/trans-isomerase [Maudiozyma saulgeensis]|uniref:Serine/threonine-protein phosphatase 2A activator n=1 Tax=Maudiozyma saulgeensis TaxID=1789683 RepID=A0A1X7QWU2_9SACH|nr:similar to Saccharomyces cerevisiae YIL153W RRD1 Peptidyl-prolyl cis/trans-isomerase [Kazachstania saulgeensis]